MYDALVSKRVYKDAYGREEALRMIRDGACGTFNHALLACFFRVERELRGLYQAPKEGNENG